ncbi:hypothetical protein ACS0PU_005842 [Formica fusca]
MCTLPRAGFLTPRRLRQSDQENIGREWTMSGERRTRNEFQWCSRRFLGERITLKIQRRSAVQCRQKLVPRLRILRHFLAYVRTRVGISLSSLCFFLSLSPSLSPSPVPAASSQGLVPPADGPTTEKAPTKEVGETQS